MKIKNVWAVIGVLIVVIISGFAARSVTGMVYKTDSAKSENKTISENVSGVLVTVEPTALTTDTPVSEPTSKPILTPTTVKTTATVAPTPTKYLRNPNPVTQADKMENIICAHFSEGDCQRAISLATTRNPSLNPELRSYNQYDLGLFQIGWANDTTLSFLGYTKDNAVANRAAIESSLKNPDTNSKLAVEYVSKFGWTSAQTMMH